MLALAIAGLVVGFLVAGLCVLFRHEQGANAAAGGGVALVLEPAFTGLQIDDEPVPL